MRELPLERRSPGDDERAVSTTVGYVLTLAIGAVLLSGVVIGVGGVLDSQTNRAVHGDLSVVGQGVVANLESADRLARAAEAGRADPAVDAADGNAAVEVEVDLPRRVAGIPYTVEVGSEAVTVRTHRPDARVRIPHTARVDVAETTLRGGPLLVVYDADPTDPTNGTLEVRER
ncbi:MAG: hypothetical protein PPP55_03945 [Halorubrum sp.]